MNIVKSSELENNKIVSYNKFIINKIMPIAIREVSPTNFLMLFIAKETFDDTVIYLQVPFKANNDKDIDYFKNHRLNIFNVYNLLKENPDNMQLKNKIASYKELSSHVTSENCYITDLSFKSMDNSMYYNMKAYREIDQESNAALDIYATFAVFIRINYYINRLFVLDNNEVEQCFINEDFHDIELVNITNVELDGTTTYGIDDEKTYYVSHYTMTDGKSIFKFNWVTGVLKSKVLTKGIDKYLYNTLFLKDKYIVCAFEFEDEIYILHGPLMSGKMYALKLNEKHMEKLFSI